MGLLEAAGPPPRAPGPLPTRQFKQLWSGLLSAVAARKIPGRSPSARPWFPRAAHTSGSTEATLDPTGSAGHPPGEPERPMQLLETEAASSALGVQSPRASAPKRAPSHARPAGPAGRCFPRVALRPSSEAWLYLHLPSLPTAGRLLSVFPVNPDPLRSVEAKTRPSRGIAFKPKSLSEGL